MKVKVTAKGYYDLDIREPGEILDVPDDFKASWVEPVEAEPAKPKKKRSRKKKPTTKTKASEAAPDDGGGD